MKRTSIIDIAGRGQKISLGRMMSDAQTAMGYEARTAPGFDAPTSIIETPAISGGWVGFGDSFIPAASASAGATFGGGITADSEQRLDGFLAKHSRVAQAGASIILSNQLPPAGMTAGADELALYSRPTNFRIIKPAPFQYLADADPSIYTRTSQSFVHDDSYADIVDDFELRMEDAPSHAFRVVVSRRQQNQFAPELIEYEICKSIAMGLANQADETLLKVLTIATEKQPNPFSLGAAASKNLAFTDLFGLVGTDGTGAAVRADGTLSVSGIDAELTSGTSATIIGAWNRAAVAISDELHVLVRRATASGDLEVTAFCQIRALIPDSLSFWKVV